MMLKDYRCEYEYKYTFIYLHVGSKNVQKVQMYLWN